MKASIFQGRACTGTVVRQLAPWVVLFFLATSVSNLRAFEYLDALVVDELVADIAVAAESGVAYVAVARLEGGLLLKVDLDTLKILDQLNLAPEQEASDVLLQHPDGNRLYLSTYQYFPFGEARLLEIRRSDFEILRQLSLPGPTYTGVVAPDGESLYLQQMINDHAGLLRVELDELTITDELVLNPAPGFALDLAIEPGGEFLLAAVDGNVSFSGGEGGLFRVDLDDLSVTALVSTDPSHRHFLSVAMTDDGQAIWALAREHAFWDLPGEGPSSLLKVNPETMNIEASIDLPVGFMAQRSLALDPNPSRNYAYLTDWNDQGWLRVDLAALSLAGQIAIMPGAQTSRQTVVVGDFAWSAGQSQVSRLSLLPLVFFQDRFEPE